VVSMMRLFRSFFRLSLGAVMNRLSFVRSHHGERYRGRVCLSERFASLDLANKDCASLPAWLVRSGSRRRRRTTRDTRLFDITKACCCLPVRILSDARAPSPPGKSQVPLLMRSNSQPFQEVVFS
jgi:hypothetical protein